MAYKEVMNKLLCVHNQHLGSPKSCREAKVQMDADTEILPKRDP